MSDLVAPAARQGPGPMPRAVIDALDVRLGRLVTRSLPGDRRAAGVGVGVELAQLRPYEVGDDVRHLDAAASARTGQPHVRLHVPDRALATWLVLDLSPSMAFGTTRRLKADVAEGAALVFGRVGIRRAGSVGVIAFGGADVRLLAPRGSRPGLVALRRLLSEGVSPDGSDHPGALADALRRVGRLATQPGLVVVISDFRRQHDWERPLGSLRLHHAVLAVEVHDPREAELPPAGRLAVVDPETGAHIEVDTRSRALRQRFGELERERRARLQAELRRLRVPHIDLSSGADWLAALGRALR